MRSKLPALALLVFLSSCGDYNRTWNMAEPFAPLVVDSPENIPAAQARAAFAAAIGALGGAIVPGAAQVVHIRYDPDCDCRTCSDKTVAHTERFSQSVIQLCPRYKLKPAWGLTDNIFHELGHVLGQWDHLPCQDVMMSPGCDCRRTHDQYTVQDVLWIKQGDVGGVSGGVFGERP